MPKKFTLGKEDRLKSRKAIELLFKEGQRFMVAPFRVFYLAVPKKGLEFGAGAPARNFKKAVDRNRIKRLTREGWRLQKLSLQKELEGKNTGLHVFLIYTDKEIADYALVYQKITTIINKLVKLVNENIPENS